MNTLPSIRPVHCFICPTFGHYDYARAAVASFLTHTPRGIALVIDDAHPEFAPFWERDWNVLAHRFPDRGGLTRSWNFGLAWARALQAEFAICSNNDVLFTPEWNEGLEAVLRDPAIAVAGPLSNAPGWTNTSQNIWDHVAGYEATDAPEAIAAVAAQLRRRYRVDEHLPVDAVNGFFMMGRTVRWWEGAFDREHVFDPAPHFALTGNEDELQRRFRSAGRRSAVSLRSFIFHYRSVTRGERSRHGLWYRRRGAPAVESP